MKIIIKVNENKELESIYCTDKDCEIEVYDYYECVACGDATEEEMDREFEEDIEGMYEIYNADTYWDEDFEE